MAAIVDGIYYGCKTKYGEKCVKHGIKIINNFDKSKHLCENFSLNSTYVGNVCIGIPTGRYIALFSMSRVKQRPTKANFSRCCTHVIAA